MARIRVTLDIEWDENAGHNHPSRWDWATLIEETEVTVVEWEDVTDDEDDDDMLDEIGGPLGDPAPLFLVVGEGTYDSATDEVEMRREP